MTTINLKDFYAWYTHDEYIEVSDEVAAELKADKLYEAAHQRRTTRNKAQYSLDCDDGIEYSACLHKPTPQELLDRMELFVHLWNVLNSLPEVQGVRVEAHLILGKSYTGPVTVNLTHIPHILLGGSTGSGKSVLLKLLLMQALRKGAEVYIADFKGGVDFPKVWHEKCRMCFTEEDLRYTLDQLVAVLEYRKSAFKALGCPNIDAYNETTEQPLPRLIFACDEVAEMLDKTGADNERKKLLAQIENKLSTIARQGRAFGVHLILATQRPDATIIPGQIRNNMDFRVCGRADSVLSQIILDNTSAAEQIPKDARGRFITGDGTVFQGYLFDEGQL